MKPPHERDESSNGLAGVGGQGSRISKLTLR
jgi:hypothetical protein